VHRGRVLFVVVVRRGHGLWWCVVCGVSCVALPVSFRARRQASPLGRGDVGAICQPPAGDRRWWVCVSWVLLVEVGCSCY
jgi:hypothetical protein